MSSRTAEFVPANSFSDEAYLRHLSDSCTDPAYNIQVFRMLFARQHWIYYRALNPEVFDDITISTPDQQYIRVFYPYNRYMEIVTQIRNGV